jgi:hypothetical protein
MLVSESAFNVMIIIVCFTMFDELLRDGYDPYAIGE